ncbi:MAG TPA: hypothetical protein VK908_08805, partial [Jiangellales bacterium]|nr:hypothetical protein [Jiangellales bacterium]
GGGLGLYVLNAGSNEITGIRVGGGELAPISGSTRPTSGPTAAPGQVSFTPDGDQLIVAERRAQLLGVYPVDAAGVAGSPTFVASSGAVPFGSDFDNKGHVIVSEVAGAPGGSAVSSYEINDGDLDLISASVPRPREPRAGSSPPRTASSPTRATPAQRQ